VLAGVRERLPGTVVFVFQPAEERPPPGERGGAELMLEEGVFDDPTPDAIFGLHVVSQHQVGEIAFVSGGAMSSSDVLRVRVIGSQTHAAYPWKGVDTIAVAARIVLALQAIPARQVDVRSPAVVSIGSIHGGVRHNIIPEAVDLLGTIRSLDEAQRREIHEKIRTTAVGIAESAGAKVEVNIELGYPITFNDPELTDRMTPTLRRIAGRGHVVQARPRTGAEDFAFYQERIPGLYVWLGGRPADVSASDAAPNHSPRFFVDEGVLPLGVRTLAGLAIDFLADPTTE
jgi:amidohydrolase